MTLYIWIYAQCVWVYLAKSAKGRDQKRHEPLAREDAWKHTYGQSPPPIWSEPVIYITLGGYCII